MRQSRPYRSELRAEQAARTKQRILEAARKLFAERGYAASTMQQIAAEAGVALPTLTGLFPNKPTLLEHVLRSAVRGDSDQQRPTMRQQLAATLKTSDPHQLLAQVARLYRKGNERGFELFEILRKAATSDPQLEARRREAAESRRRDQTAIARHLHQSGALHPALSRKHATDILWLYSASDIYRLLITDSGWTADQYEQWLHRTLTHTLLK